MSELYATLPGSVPIELDGKTYQFAPLRLRDHAEIDRIILEGLTIGGVEFCRKRPSPIDVADEAIKKLPEPLHHKILELAYSATIKGPVVTHEERYEWRSSGVGRIVTHWIRLKQNHKELTLDNIDELFARQSVIDGIEAERLEKEKERELHAKTGEGDLKNSEAPLTGANCSAPASTSV